MKHDVYFDGIASHFEQDIYESSKGYIRWKVLWHDLITGLPLLEDKPLRSLDAGGGAGRMSVALAKLGHFVVLCEPSNELLEKARDLAIQENVAQQVDFVNRSLQSYALRGS